MLQKRFFANIRAVLTKIQQNHRYSAPLMFWGEDGKLEMDIHFRCVQCWMKLLITNCGSLFLNEDSLYCTSLVIHEQFMHEQGVSYKLR